MPKLYGSHLCKDCQETFRHFEKINYKYEFIEITESMPNLREFLKIRDNRDEFVEIRKEGLVGIPTLLMEDDSILFLDDILELKK